MKHLIIFGFILFLATFLRIYKLDTLMPFFSDQGRDFLAARDFIVTGDIPLLGIPSSVPRFKQGPLYVWLIAISLLLGNFHPFTAALMAVGLSLSSIIATYYLSKKFFSGQAALISTLILATSVFAVTNGRLAYHTNALPLATVIYLYFILNIIQD